MLEFNRDEKSSIHITLYFVKFDEELHNTSQLLNLHALEHYKLSIFWKIRLL